MTLRELRYLVAIADYGHFGRAAESCGASQPTLSTQLKKLEDSLGVMLFERTNKALHTTPIGKEIVEKARRLLEDADSIIDLARRKTGPLAGTLNLGIIPTLSPYLLPWLLPVLASSYPDLRLIIHEDITDNLIERLKSHRLDSVLAALPIVDRELEVLPVFNEPFVLACPFKHRLAKKMTIRTEDLRQENLLLLTDGHCLRDQALAVCGFEKPRGENVDFRATSLETLCHMVAAGMGCTLLPVMAVNRASQHDVKIRPLDDTAFRQIGLVWRKTYPKPDEVGCLSEVIRRCLPADINVSIYQ